MSYYSFGGRYGHINCLRKEGVKLFGADVMAELSDEEVEQKFIDSGYIPMFINYQNSGDEDETIYLVKAEELDKMIKLYR